ncbi:MAG TPA: aldo/keto reductase [Candidatus Acidoferrales bacterium]|nr:aldo/keto reductase [Candidatus Acidoferrales bacterium]
MRLGNTGLRVSRLCLGTMTFGYQCDEPTSFAILDRAAEGGITFLDSSDVYPLGGGLERAGRTEEIIGRWIKGKRHDWVIATKCFGATGPQPFHAGNNRRHIFDAVDASLRRLGTDYVDLYQLHGYDPQVTADETLGALDDLVRAGKVRYVGCSNYLAYQVARALGRSDVRGWARFVSVQPRYNLLYREIERELLPLCAEEGVGVIPFNPIAGGMLTGKHDGARPANEGTRFAYTGRVGDLYRDRYWHEHIFKGVEELQSIAARAGLPLATLAVGWVLSNPAITSPIIGASKPEQLDATLASLDVTLDAGLLAELDTATRRFR